MNCTGQHCVHCYTFTANNDNNIYIHAHVQHSFSPSFLPVASTPVCNCPVSCDAARGFIPMEQLSESVLHNPATPAAFHCCESIFGFMYGHN